MNKKINTKSLQSAVGLEINQDFKNALIIVSVAINLFVLTAWLVAQFSSDYAAQLISLI